MKSIDVLVGAGGSKPKKLSMILSGGTIRLVKGEKEKCNRSLLGATVTSLGGGRVEIKFERVTQRRSPRFGKNKLRFTNSFIVWIGEADLDTWTSALVASAAGGDKESRKKSGESALTAMRMLVDMNSNQQAFWNGNGLR
jgi:hypothetical protein